jgi:hypothetical protein
VGHELLPSQQDLCEYHHRENGGEDKESPCGGTCGGELSKATMGGAEMKVDMHTHTYIHTYWCPCLVRERVAGRVMGGAEMREMCVFVSVSFMWLDDECVKPILSFGFLYVCFLSVCVRGSVALVITNKKDNQSVGGEKLKFKKHTHTNKQTKRKRKRDDNKKKTDNA